MIHAEVMRGPDTAPDKAAFENWFAKRGNRILTVDTVYGTMWKAPSEEKRREIKRFFPNAGEESIREFAGKVADLLPPGDQILAHLR